MLKHYDINLPIHLAGDASQYGVGAVISHTMPDGSERPIAWASRTLSSSEKRYSQVEKEALALVFGVKYSTSICMGDNSHWSPIISPSQRSWGPRVVYRHWPLRECKDGPYSSLATATIFGSILPRLMGMQMGCPTFHLRTHPLVAIVRMQLSSTSLRWMHCQFTLLKS